MGIQTEQGRQSITIDSRYEGPPGITLGGYLSGLMASYMEADTVCVTMHIPTPMERPLIIDTNEPDQVRLYDGDVLLNDARPVEWTLSLPEPISYEQAQGASLRDTVSAYPNCFGCGSGRAEHDGLHLRAGPVEGRSNVVAIDWTPDRSVVGADPDGRIPQLMLLTAMECPIAKALVAGRLLGSDEQIVLGRVTTKIVRTPDIGEACYFMGWPIERAGRRIELAGALFDQAGEALVTVRHTFVVPRAQMY